MCALNFRSPFFGGESQKIPNTLEPVSRMTLKRCLGVPTETVTKIWVSRPVSSGTLSSEVEDVASLPSKPCGVWVECFAFGVSVLALAPLSTKTWLGLSVSYAGFGLFSREAGNQ
jgi:hypothetical protein